MLPIIEARELTKRYGPIEALRAIDLRVEEGEIFGLLGPNGAGKTTAISILTGIIPPTSGMALVGGHDVVRETTRAKRLNGLVPQDLALYPTLSARANLAFFGRIYGLGGRALNERVADALHIVGLEERADDPVQTYSGGMKRRANIAAGLVHGPRVLFMDEPTVGVDPQSRNSIFESVRHLNRERGMTIIYTSHYMEEVQALCSRVAIIDEGRIVAIDTVRNLIAMLGGGVIQVGLASVDDALVERLGALPGVLRASQVAPPAPTEAEGESPSDGAPAMQVVKIEAHQSQQALLSLVGFLGEQGLPATSLEILEPNLESVFLHLTGRRLRE